MKRVTPKGMPMTSLYTRMRTHGTLTETPDEIPDAVFALPSTLNWMRAEAILVSDCALDFNAAQAFYGRVQRKELSERQLNSVFEQLLFSLHQIAALRGMAAVPNKADVARVGMGSSSCCPILKNWRFIPVHAASSLAHPTHSQNASARFWRKVDAVIVWRRGRNRFAVSSWTARSLCAWRADLNRPWAFSRFRVGLCEPSMRLFSPLCARWSTASPSLLRAAP